LVFVKCSIHFNGKIEVCCLETKIVNGKFKKRTSGEEIKIMNQFWKKGIKNKKQTSGLSAS